MQFKRGGAELLSLWLAVSFAFPVFPAKAAGGDAVSECFAEAMLWEGERSERALLIGMDEFVSKPNTYPSSVNNVFAMQETFQAAREPLKTLLIPSEPVTSAQELTELIQETFADADEDDVSYLYISTHGIYDSLSGEEPALLLSDGQKEGLVTAGELEAALREVKGTKVLILDACNSGAFIGKGDPDWQKRAHFLGDEFKVLTSSGALEESWYWSADDLDVENAPLGAAEQDARRRPFTSSPSRFIKPQGAFYFTQSLSQGLSPRYGYPADSNQDGLVTLSEMYEFLLQNHAASIPQVYPQQDDFVIFRYDTNEARPSGTERSPVLGVTFSGTMLDQENRSVTLEYIATRPVRVGYQIVYQKEGKWRFDEAKLHYDDEERFTAFGDQKGGVSAGYKTRTLTLDAVEQDASGYYMMVQLVSIDQGKVTIHAGRVFCVPPSMGDLQMAVSVKDTYARGDEQELSIFVAHAYPCALSVAIVNESDEVVTRLCHRWSTRPSQTTPKGSLFYWDGLDKNDNPVPTGQYRVRASGMMNDLTFTVMSEPVQIE